MDSYTITIAPNDDSGNTTRLVVDTSGGQVRITDVHLHAAGGLTGGQLPTVDFGLLLRAIAAPSAPAADGAAPRAEPVPVLPAQEVPALPAPHGSERPVAAVEAGPSASSEPGPVDTPTAKAPRPRRRSKPTAKAERGARTVEAAAAGKSTAAAAKKTAARAAKKTTSAPARNPSAAPADPPAPKRRARAAATAKATTGARAAAPGKAPTGARPAAIRKAPSGARPAAPGKAATGNGRAYRRMPDDIAAVYDQAGSPAAVAEHYSVPRHTAQGWLRRLRRATVQ